MNQEKWKNLNIYSAFPVISVRSMGESVPTMQTARRLFEHDSAGFKKIWLRRRTSYDCDC